MFPTVDKRASTVDKRAPVLYDPSMFARSDHMDYIGVRGGVGSPSFGPMHKRLVQSVVCGFLLACLTWQVLWLISPICMILGRLEKPSIHPIYHIIAGLTRGGLECNIGKTLSKSVDY
jgi:hypothetical protein